MNSNIVEYYLEYLHDSIRVSFIHRERWNLKFPEEKGDWKKNWTNLQMQWLFQMQGIIYALLMRYHFRRIIICPKHVYRRFVLIIQTEGIFRSPSVCPSYSILLEHIPSLLINRIFLLCLPNQRIRFFVIR